MGLEVFFSLIFAIFVVFLFVDQVQAIRYDLTYVEYLKQYHYSTVENNLYDCLISCMGEPPCFRWLLPIEGSYMIPILRRLSCEYISIHQIESSDSESSSSEELSLEEKKNQ